MILRSRHFKKRFNFKRIIDGKYLKEERIFRNPLIFKKEYKEILLIRNKDILSILEEKVLNNVKTYSLQKYKIFPMICLAFIKGYRFVNTSKFKKIIFGIKLVKILILLDLRVVFINVSLVSTSVVIGRELENCRVILLIIKGVNSI